MGKNIFKQKKSVNVGIIYRHPGYDFSEFHESIIDCIHKLNQSRNKFIICGDINIDLLRYGKDLKVNRYVNEITSLGCIIPIDKPTRLTETSSTIIDHFYTNELLTSIDSKIILSDITDHFPILLNINYSTLKTETIRCNSYYRDNSQFNPENFLIELEHSFLQSFILNDQEYSINSRFQEFDRIFLQLLNKHIPLKCRTRKDLYRWRKPWMNKNILQQIKTKNNLFQKFLKSRDIEDLQKYKSFRNTLSKIIRRNKVLYYQNRIKKSQKTLVRFGKQ